MWDSPLPSPLPPQASAENEQEQKQLEQELEQMEEIKGKIQAKLQGADEAKVVEEERIRGEVRNLAQSRAISRGAAFSEPSSSGLAKWTIE